MRPGTEWIIVIGVIAVIFIFGGKKLPEAARGLGRSLRIFKAETKGLNEPEAGEAAAPAESTTPTPPGEKTEA